MSSASLENYKHCTYRSNLSLILRNNMVDRKNCSVETAYKSCERYVFWRPVAGGAINCIFPSSAMCLPAYVSFPPFPNSCSPFSAPSVEILNLNNWTGWKFGKRCMRSRNSSNVVLQFQDARIPKCFRTVFFLRREQKHGFQSDFILDWSWTF